MSLWKNMSLNKKFTIFALLLLSTILFIGYLFLDSTNTSRKGFDKVLAIEELSAEISLREVDHIEWGNKLQRDLLTGRDLSVSVDPKKCAFGQWYYSENRKEAEQLFPGLVQPLTEIEAFHNGLHQSAVGIQNALNDSNRDGALRFYAENTEPNLNAVRAKFRVMLDMLHDNMVNERANFNSEMSQSEKITMIVIVSGFIVCLLLTLTLARSTSGPVTRLADYARKVASGDLNATFVIDRKDEIGQLAEALQAIPNVLNTIIREYQDLALKVKKGNIQVLGDPGKFNGAYADLVTGTNSIIRIFQTIVESIPSPVFLMNEKLQVAYANSAAQRMVGKDFQGRLCNELYSLGDYTTDRCALKVAVSSGLSSSSETTAQAQGKRYQIEYTAIPFLDEDRKLTAVLQLITDLTHVKEIQEHIINVANKAHAIANQVGTASGELTARVNEVSNGAMIQKDRVASTATAMEEMNSTVLEVAKNAGLARERAEVTKGKAGEGSSLVVQLIKAVENVRELTEIIETDMQKLGTQAESIGTVMNVISDIADQTNLLALNAAIEAARAGEAGRGFAVVADEVRKLAENTMSATVEVGRSIKDIQHSTADTIEHMEDAAKGVDNATSVAVVSGEALQTILQLADETASLIMGIATAAEQQSATSDEINLSVDDIHNIANSTAEEMQVSARATESLAQMVAELRALLEELKR